jgi:NitT/TauT family transport system ATP-binding protein
MPKREAGFGYAHLVMTAQPGKVKTFVPVPLTRPRNIMELQQSPEYGGLIAQIWSSLREEVQRARAREEEMTS